MSLTEIFWDVDDFSQEFLPKWEQSLLEEENNPIEQKKRKRKFTLTPSEVMTLVIYFHQSGYRNLGSAKLKRM